MRCQWILVVAVAALLVAGCKGKDGDGGDKPAPAPTAEKQPEAAPEATAPAEEEPAEPAPETAQAGTPDVTTAQATDVAAAAEAAPAAHQDVAAMQDAQEEDVDVKAKAFLDGYNKDYAAHDKANNLAYWKAANSGKSEDFDAYAATELALKTLHSDAQRYQAIQDLLTAGDKLDPMLHRALSVALLRFKGNQLPKEILEDLVKTSTDIEQVFNTFRPEYQGQRVTNNDLLKVLGDSTDTAERKAAWESLKLVGEAVGGKLVALAHKRNKAARHLGYENFWEMQVRLQEHDPAMLVQIFDDLGKATDAPFRAMKAEMDAELARRFGIEPAEMMPWHYDNPFFQQAPPSDAVDLDIFYEHMTKEEVVALGGTFFKDIGLDADDIIAHSDFYEREGKDQHAFCMSVDREGDVRMLLNVKPTAEWMDTMLHETGHGVYDKYVQRSLPFNLREPAHIFTTEGIAMLFGALAKNPTWLVGYAKADADKVASLAEPLRIQRQREQLIFARWVLVMFNFERALYENPDQDLNTLWYDLVERFQLLKRPADRNLADWAAKPHFTIAPVYYHNYQLGELFAAQLRATIARRVGHEGPTSTIDFVGKKEIGEFLIKAIFEPGATSPWPEFVKQATGSPLSIDAYVAEVK